MKNVSFDILTNDIVLYPILKIAGYALLREQTPELRYNLCVILVQGFEKR